MATQSSNEHLLKEMLSAMRDNIEVPHPSDIKARQLLTVGSKIERQDVISFIASFLNMRVKLYHVVIGFVCIWLCYLYLDQKPETIKHEATRSAQSSPLASANNTTVLPCIQTFCLKK